MYQHTPPDWGIHLLVNVGTGRIQKLGGGIPKFVRATIFLYSWTKTVTELACQRLECIHVNIRSEHVSP